MEKLHFYMQFLPHTQKIGQVDPAFQDEQVLEDNDRNMYVTNHLCYQTYLKACFMVGCANIKTNYVFKSKNRIYVMSPHPV